MKRHFIREVTYMAKKHFEEIFKLISKKWNANEDYKVPFYTL